MKPTETKKPWSTYRKSTKKWLLGRLKGKNQSIIYLEDFSWDCDWYWGGGYIGNRSMHTHFDGCFLNSPDSRGHCLGNFFDRWTKLPEYLKGKDVKRIKNSVSVWEDLEFFLDDAQYDSHEWWRIKDLFKQFYSLRESAEVFHNGGHCSSVGRNEKEINYTMRDKINQHIYEVIIPELHKVLDHEWRKGKFFNGDQVKYNGKKYKYICRDDDLVRIKNDDEMIQVKFSEIEQV